MLRKRHEAPADAGPSDFAKIDLKSVTATGLKTLEFSYVLYDASTGVLDDLLAKRVGKLNRQRGLSQAASDSVF